MLMMLIIQGSVVLAFSSLNVKIVSEMVLLALQNSIVSTKKR